MKNNSQSHLKILFIGKSDDFFSVQASQFLLLHFPDATVIFGKRNEPFPMPLYEWKGDLIISYLSQWIIPKEVLNNAQLAALNFHPGPPEYPGIGCTNFAIYNRVDEFGITCHHMNPKVDTGNIVAVKRFPVYMKDTVYAITQRCYAEILNLFYEIFYLIMDGQPIPSSPEKWQRKPYLRSELNELCKLTPDMTEKEMALRIEATTYLKPWAFFDLGGKQIHLTEEDIQNKRYLNYLEKK